MYLYSVFLLSISDNLKTHYPAIKAELKYFILQNNKVYFKKTGGAVAPPLVRAVGVGRTRYRIEQAAPATPPFGR